MSHWPLKRWQTSVLHVMRMHHGNSLLDQKTGESFELSALAVHTESYPGINTSGAIVAGSVTQIWKLTWAQPIDPGLPSFTINEILRDYPWFSRRDAIRYQPRKRGL